MMKNDSICHKFNSQPIHLYDMSASQLIGAIFVAVFPFLVFIWYHLFCFFLHGVFLYHLKELNKFCKSLNNFCLLFIHATLYMKFALYNSQRTENTLYGQSYMYEWHLCAILILRVDSKGQTAFLYIWMYWSNRVTRFWSLTDQ